MLRLSPTSFSPFTLLALATMVAAGPLAAEEQEQPRRQVSFSVEAATKTDQDQLTAQLYVEVQRLKAAEAASEVNSIMAEALDSLENSSGIDYSTPAYQTYPVYDEGRISSWRVRQILELESSDKAAVTSALAELQKSLSVQSINFGVSRGTREEVQAQLTKEVLQKFKQRAGLITSTMEAATYTIVNISIDTAGGMQPQFQRAEIMMARDSQAPALDAGQSEIVVNAHATIELVFDGGS